MNDAERTMAHHFQNIEVFTGKTKDGKMKVDGKTREDWILNMERALVASGTEKAG